MCIAMIIIVLYRIKAISDEITKRKNDILKIKSTKKKLSHFNYQEIYISVFNRFQLYIFVGSGDGGPETLFPFFI